MTDELIERFFNKQCTSEETDEVTTYLKEHPDVMEKYLAAAEWFGAGSQAMPEEFWSDNWKGIKQRRSSTVRRIWLKAAAVAAVALITMGLLYQHNDLHKKPVALASAEKQATMAIRKITANTTDAIMRIDLPDSSTVALSPGSLITYPVPFAKDKREITLDGEGRFAVMKNERKPFTVFAGDLATTALGTEFTINTKNSVNVKLHTGRVLITATGDLAKHWKEDVILKPGQQLNYSLKEMTASVSNIPAQNTVARNAPVKKRKKAVAEEIPGMNFVNTSLPDVMKKLMEHYSETITFDSAEISDMNFTGAISENDSLPVVLKIIAQMNGLQVDHNDDGYTLKKSVQ